MTSYETPGTCNKRSRSCLSAVWILHGGLNPGQEVLDVGVDSGLTRSGAPDAPADRAPQYIAAGGPVSADERPTAVAFARVFLALLKTRADHPLGDL